MAIAEEEEKKRKTVHTSNGKGRLLILEVNDGNTSPQDSRIRSD